MSGGAPGWMIFTRRRVLLNTDPHRRVYNGAFFSSVEMWGQWTELCPFATRAAAEESLVSWREHSPKCEFEIRP